MGHGQRFTPVSTSTPDQTLQRSIDAYNAHDLEAYLACFTPAAIFGQLGGRTLLDSRDAMRGFYKQFFEARPTVRCAVRQRSVLGPYVIDLQEISDEAQPPMQAMLISQIDPADQEGRIGKVWYAPLAPAKA